MSSTAAPIAPSGRTARLRGRAARVVAAVMAAALIVVVGACIPQNRRNASEVGEGAQPRSAPPEFPRTGQVPVDLLVEGLVYDFTVEADTLELWVPRDAEAECAAEAIVAALTAPRLSELGYLPGTPGASLNDIALSPAERTLVVQAFTGCVDMVEANASIFMGSANMAPKEAVCLAEGLDAQGLSDVFVRAWVAGQEVDPFAQDGAFVTAFLSYAKVCLPGDSFTWFGVDLPGDDPEDLEDPDGSDDGSDDDSGSGAGGDGGTGTVTTTTEGRPTGGLPIENP